MEQKQKKKTSEPYSPEFRQRAVRLVMEHRDDYQSEAAALTAIAGKLGCSPDSLRTWVPQTQRDAGERPRPTSTEISRIKELERVVLKPCSSHQAHLGKTAIEKASTSASATSCSMARCSTRYAGPRSSPWAIAHRRHKA
jgi:transposase